MQTFTHDRYRNATEVSKKVWELKDKNVDYDISSKVLQRAHPYKGGGSRCDLCAAEKLYILKNPNSLNKRSELVSKCMYTQRNIC